MALVVFAVSWFFYASGHIGTMALIAIGLGAGVLIPAFGLVFRRWFILFTEPIANLLTMDEIIDANSDLSEFIALLAYVLSLILVVVGAVLRLPLVLSVGLVMFIGYGVMAPRIFHLRIEGDPPEVDSRSLNGSGQREG